MSEYLPNHNGVFNTSNDLGTVRRGQIIRSDKLSKLTANDFQKLEEMGLKTVIDLRTNQEQGSSPMDESNCRRAG